jgi:signal transduction histidine kinase
MVKIIVDEVDRLNQVVTQFLDYARPMQIQLEPMDAAALVGNVVGLLDAQGLPPSVTVTEEHAAVRPPVSADGPKLKQVLLNLCQNGLYAMRQGGTLTARTRMGRLHDPKARNAPAIEIVVEDTGVGITKEDLDKLFVPFFTTRHDGTGLGLAISRRIVQAHGGELDVSSTPGKGSIFTVRVPLQPASAEEAGTVRSLAAG